MITIFSTAKSFEDSMAYRNSVASWRLITSDVILFDDETLARQGMGQSQTGAAVIPDMFKMASIIGMGDVLCYVNADIILTSDLIHAVNAAKLAFDTFLLVGRRFGWRHPRIISIDDLDRNREQFEAEVRSNGELFVAATDYFCFTRAVYDYDEIPPMYMGRYYQDPWLFYHVTQKGIPVIDVTKAVFAIHQNHPVSHRSLGPEGIYNRELAQEAEIDGIDLDNVPYEMIKDLEIVKR